MNIFMVVDDSPIIRKVARRILEGIGYIVSEAVDGVDALEKCTHSMPDVIMVDWDMPRMNGVEFIEALRGTEGSQNARILFCTSEVMMTEMMKAKRAGCDGYLMKPFTRSIVEQKLAELGVRSVAA